MALDDNDKAQRRVYVLPKELVDRVVDFQNKVGLQSEVEAARRLLDEALKYREDSGDIIRRFTQIMRDTKVLSDIVRDVLIGHPKVTTVHFDPSSVRVELSTDEEITFYAHGGGHLKRGGSKPVPFDKSGLLDEIPF